MLLRSFLSRLWKENRGLYILLVIVALLSSFLIIDLLCHITEDRANNLSSGQLIIELIGLGIIILTIYQFLDYFKSPKLSVILDYFDSNKEWVETNKYIRSRWNKVSATHTIDENDKVSMMEYCFRFRLFVDNLGNKAGHYIKVTAELKQNGAQINPKYVEYTRDKQTIAGKWKDEYRIHRFYGKEDFIAYSRPKHRDDYRNWLEEIGAFTIKIPASSDARDKMDLKLHTSIQGLDTDLVSQTFVFRFD